MDDLSDDWQEYLQRLDWVQGFHIAKANEECNTRHLEIVCKFGMVPRITDVLRHFGEDVLPYVTYMAEKLPEGAEFELFNEDGTLKDVYDTPLKSFEWVENYKTGIVITCKDGEVPSMGDLRKYISKDVLPCVEFAKSEHWSAAEEKDTKSQSDLKESDINEECPTVSTLASKETKDLSSYFGKKSRKFSGDLNPFERALSDDWQEYLQRLHWVQDFDIAEANEECNTEHLEIVCKFGKVPRITDLLKYFGEDVLPSVTYKAEKLPEGDDSSWFRTELYDENFDLKDEHVEFLCSLKWVQAFAIAGQNEECDTLHLVITCRRGEVPCMAELKKQFGKEISFYVEFLPGTDDENFQFLVNENNHTDASRYPMSGDGIKLHDDSNNDRRKRYGTIGVFACKNGKETKHYATTCYHVSYNGTKRLPKKSDAEKHKMLCQDSENLCSSTRISKYCYFKAKEPEGKEKLGGFSWGKFSELHDFSMLEISSRVPCACSINNTGCIITCNRNIKKEIDDELLKKPAVIVEKTGCATGTTKGVLIQRGCTIKWQDKEDPRLKNGFLIKDLPGSELFARHGDSGCIVNLVVGEKKSPFAYLVYSLSKTIDKKKGPERVYFCFDLAKSFEEFTKYEGKRKRKRKNNSHSTKLRLIPCAGR